DALIDGSDYRNGLSHRWSMLGSMRPEERDQVVELLRCAADLGIQDRGLLVAATTVLDIAWDGPEVEYARRAWRDAYASNEDASDGESLLEAAARVEEGSWP